MTDTETAVLDQLREAVRAVLLCATAPLATTAVQALLGQVPGHLVYRALVGMERAGEVQRCGRVGTAARAEVLWQLATVDGRFNQAFADLLAEIEQDEQADFESYLEDR